MQQRRQIREQEAYMQSVLNEPEAAAWTQIAPLLDTALAQLGEKDHDAIVLRFFQNKSLNEIGAALGTKRSHREKARESRAGKTAEILCKKRGVPSTTAIIAGAISAHSVQAAPTVLAKSVTAIAIAKWRGSQWFDLNAHQRNTETYGMDKSKNGPRCRHHCCHYWQLARPQSAS